MNLDPSANDMRPFFFDLWKRYHFHTATLAELADVPEDMILAMLRFQPVPPPIAERVLAVVDDVFKEGYTLSSVKVNLFSIEEEINVIGQILRETREYAINPVFKEALQQQYAQ